MKKTKFIALSLVVAVMMMGAGYAWWFNTIEIHNTVNTGEFKVKFDTNFQLGDMWGPKEGKDGRDYLIRPYFTDANQDVMKATLSNLYPTADVKSNVSVKLVNEGTVAAKLGSAEIDVKGEFPEEMYDRLMVEVRICEAVPNGGTSYQGAIRKNGTLGTLKETIEAALNQATVDGVLLEPKEARMLRLSYYLHTESSNELQDKTVTPEIKLNWEQFNR